MTVTAHIRAALRRGGALRRVRKELRSLSDVDLVKRLARYTGHTPGEIRSAYNFKRFGATRRELDRAAIIEAIALIEVP